jgi:hypothetical protein
MSHLDWPSLQRQKYRWMQGTYMGDVRLDDGWRDGGADGQGIEHHDDAAAAAGGEAACDIESRGGRDIGIRGDEEVAFTDANLGDVLGLVLRHPRHSEVRPSSSPPSRNPVHHKFCFIHLPTLSIPRAPHSASIATPAWIPRIRPRRRLPDALRPLQVISLLAARILTALWLTLALPFRENSGEL